MIHEHLYSLLVTSVSTKWPMDRLKTKEKQFEYHPYAYYANDVQLQHTNRPSGNHIKSKPFFLGKHSLYGVKSKVSVTSVGLAIHLSKIAKGSVADKQIMLDNIDQHRQLTKKSANSMQLPDDGPFHEQYPRNWAIIMDKGYQGMLDSCRAVTPKKKPRNLPMPMADKAENKKIASDRIIVENFFGWLCLLWGLMQKNSIGVLIATTCTTNFVFHLQIFTSQGIHFM